MLPTDINSLTIIRWDRDTIGATVSMASNEALTVLTPRLGPTGTLFLHRFARRGAQAEFTNYDHLAGELGVAPRQLVKTVERIIRFGYARWADPACETLETAVQLGTAPPTGPGTPIAGIPHLRAA
jgi:hypothetical protein